VTSGSSLDEPRLRRLLEVGRSLVADLDLEVVLNRVLDVAQEITGARYVALGVLNEERSELERFLTRGIDEATHRAIGDLPRGRGILGLLIEDPRPLRLHDIGEHPRSYGFPAGHPPMRGFLGVPVFAFGETWGNLYLTEKEGGEFDATDVEAVMVLAEYAGIAIQNSRLYERAESRRGELERAVRALEATTEIARAVGAETDLARVLELIVKRGRALVSARALLLLLADEDELVVAAVAGEVSADLLGVRIPIEGSISGQVLASGRAERLSDVSHRLRFALQGRVDAEAALFVPLVYRAEALGVLMATDRLTGAGEVSEFDREDERLMQAFATSAATAVAVARRVESDRLRRTIQAAEDERRRWARELHDETLQGLGAIGVMLSSALRSGDPERLATAVAEAGDVIRDEIAGLRNLITELRPAALDELGLEPAIDALAERVRTVEGLELEATLSVPGRLEPELESTVYRLVQESLTNAAKHARATRVTIAIVVQDATLQVEVRDDGIGIDPKPVLGFGLTGMRERAELLGGTLTVERADPGTRVRAALPARYVSDGDVREAPRESGSASG
jgi:signal transduction histidine kinase